MVGPTLASHTHFTVTCFSCLLCFFCLSFCFHRTLRLIKPAYYFISSYLIILKIFIWSFFLISSYINYFFCIPLQLGTNGVLFIISDSVLHGKLKKVTLLVLNISFFCLIMTLRFEFEIQCVLPQPNITWLTLVVFDFEYNNSQCKILYK